MPINASNNKSVLESITSSTSNINNIKVKEVTNIVSDLSNNLANSVVENYDLDFTDLYGERIKIADFSKKRAKSYRTK